MFSRLFIAGILFANVGFAGQVVGNGGHAVVCRDSSGKITRAELYDYYEGRELRKLHISLPTGINNPIALASKTLERLQNFNKERTDRIAARLLTFKDEVEFVNTGLADIPDMGMVIVEPNCKIEQLVIYREPEFLYDKRFTIANEIWSQLTLEDQAGTILHELIYEDARLFGQADSQASRYLNALISATEYSTWTQQQLDDFLRRAVLREGMYIAKGNGGQTTVIIEAVLTKLNLDSAVQYCSDHTFPNRKGYVLYGHNMPWHKMPRFSPPTNAPYKNYIKLSPSWWYADNEANNGGYNALVFNGTEYVEKSIEDRDTTLISFICRYEIPEN